MGREGPRWLGGILMVVVLGHLVGCQYGQLKQENESLWLQNKELQEELTRNRLALDALETDRSRNTFQADREAAEAPAPVFASGAAANTGTDFSQIQGVEAVQGANRVTVRVPGDVLFASGKTALRKSAEKTLGEIADIIKRRYGSNTVLIKGYTDTDPIKKSKWTDNLELSLQRAAAVHRHLQKRGVDPTHMQAVGQGPWHPEKSKARSRRVEIVVVLDP